MPASQSVADYLDAWQRCAAAQQAAQAVVDVIRAAGQALSDWQGAAERIAAHLPSTWPAGLTFLRPPKGELHWPSQEEISHVLEEWAQAREALETCWKAISVDERRPLKPPEERTS
jgi:hypothetical protein